jgi:hypothetical protein
VCGTDLQILEGQWLKALPWPFTLGHGSPAEPGPVRLLLRDRRFGDLQPEIGAGAEAHEAQERRAEHRHPDLAQHG